jgi:UDP-glucuronate 4-epimerase
MLTNGEEIPMFGDGSSERDYTEVEDILDGIESALEYVRRAPGTYDVVNLGGGRTIMLRQMIDQIGDAMGVRPRVRRLPDQPGDVRRTFADLSKAERLLGYRPSVPFDEGIRRFAEWFVAARDSTQLVGSL